MALPDGITGVTVTFSAGSFAADGGVGSGSVIVSAPTNVLHIPSGEPIWSGDRKLKYTNGVASFTLCPNDQPGLSSYGWTYTVYRQINGARVQPEPFSFIVAAAGPSVIDGDALTPVPSSAGTPVSVSVATSVNGKTGTVVLSAADVGAASTDDLTTGLAGKVNSSTYTAGLAGKQDKATLGADAAATPELRAASVAAVKDAITAGDIKVGAGSAINLTQAQQVKTTADKTSALTVSTPPAFAPLADPTGAIIVNPDDTYQPFLGAGAALTDAAAYCLWNYLTPTARHNLLTELFSPDQCGWSTIRLPMGSTDFNSVPAYTYDDMPAGQTDPTLANFSVARDAAYIIPILQEILAINPRVRIMACPWTPPAWMKTSGQLYGGSLDPAYFAALAQYFVKFVQAYASYGIPIWAVSPQNEPLTSTTNYTSMTLPSADAITFIGTHLGPALVAAGLNTKLVCYDQHWDQSSYAKAVLADATAGPFTSGVAWHAYAGDPTMQSTVHRSYPLSEQHFTEMRTFSSQDYHASLQIMAGDLAVGSVRNWGNTLTLWNLALDENGGPRLFNAGRRGVLTIPSNGTGAVRNAEYYVLTHLVKYLQPGAVRIGSTSPAVGRAGVGLQTVAFRNPDQSIVLFVYNSAATAQTTQILDSRAAAAFPITVQPDEVSTFVWGTTTQATPTAAPATVAAPGAPGLTATAGATTIGLAITAGTSGGAPITGYRVLRKNGAGAFSTVAVLPANATAFTDAAVTPGSTYTYTVAARNAGGYGIESTQRSATVPIDGIAPTVPTGLTATAGMEEVALSWTASTDNIAVAGYKIRRGGTLIASPTTTSYLDTGLTGGTTYSYTVSAVDGAGNESAQTGAQTATPTVAVPPTYDASTSSASTTTTSISFSHTVGAGANRYLLVQIGTTNGANTSVTGVTANGVAMNHVIAAQSTMGSGQRHLDMWELVNPPSGAVPIVVTTGGGASAGATATSYSGVNQANPRRATGQYTDNTLHTATSVTLAGTATSDVVHAVAFARTSTDPVPAGGQTSKFTNAVSANARMIGTNQPGGGTVTPSFSWTTADAGTEIAVAIKAG